MSTIKRLDYPRGSIRLHVSTTIEEEYRIHACQKEPWTVEWIEGMAEGGVLYDVGANVGSYSLLAAALGHMVVAIEPSFANYARLCENILLNDLGDRVVPLCAAIGNQQGLTTLLAQSLEPGFSGGAKRLRAPVLTMADIPALFGVPLPTHIKVDTDGEEVEVLQTGWSDVFPSYMIEVSKDKTAMVEQVMALRGYGVRKRIDQREPGTGPPLKNCWYGVWEKR